MAARSASTSPPPACARVLSPGVFGRLEHASFKPMMLDRGTRQAVAAAGKGRFKGRTTADLLAQSARLGWMPSYPTFNSNPLDLAYALERSGQDPGTFIGGELAAGRLRFAAEDPDAPENFPRILTVWRANLLGSSGKGNEYFLKHLLRASSSVRASEAPASLRRSTARPRDPS